MKLSNCFLSTTMMIIATASLTPLAQGNTPLEAFHRDGPCDRDDLGRDDWDRRGDDCRRDDWGRGGRHDRSWNRFVCFASPGLRGNPTGRSFQGFGPTQGQASRGALQTCRARAALPMTCRITSCQSTDRGGRGW
jgi:hypothetical protein